MKVDTKQRKKARKGFAQVYGDEELAARMVHVLQVGKKGLYSLVMDLAACSRRRSWTWSGRSAPAPKASPPRGPVQVGLSGRLHLCLLNDSQLPEGYGLFAHNWME